MRSRTPRSAKYSASRRVETVAGPCGDGIMRAAISQFLQVLRWGRRPTPSEAMRWRRRARLRSILPRSSMRQGVGSCSSFSNPEVLQFPADVLGEAAAILGCSGAKPPPLRFCQRIIAIAEVIEQIERHVAAARGHRMADARVPYWELVAELAEGPMRRGVGLQQHVVQSRRSWGTGDPVLDGVGAHAVLPGMIEAADGVEHAFPEADFGVPAIASQGRNRVAEGAAPQFEADCPEQPPEGEVEPFDYAIKDGQIESRQQRDRAVGRERAQDDATRRAPTHGAGIGLEDG